MPFTGRRPAFPRRTERDQDRESRKRHFHLRRRTHICGDSRRMRGISTNRFKPIILTLITNWNQARTSTIVPLKTSNASLISGSFLKSSLSNRVGAGFSFFGSARAGWVVEDWLPGAAAEFDELEAVATDVPAAEGRTRPAVASALINLTDTSPQPSSLSLV